MKPVVSMGASHRVLAPTVLGTWRPASSLGFILTWRCVVCSAYSRSFGMSFVGNT